MSETAEFPLPYDTTDAERDVAKRELAKHVQIVSTAERSITFVGTQIGQTGPVWHLQYTRLYKVPNGYLAAARDMHEGVKVTFTKDAKSLADAFANPVVREFIEDELRYRKVI